MPVTEIEQTVAARELREWSLYWSQEPWGPWRDNAHAGLVASVMANAFRGEKQRPYQMEDFMLLDAEDNERRKAEKSARGQQIFVSLMRALAGPKNGV